MMTVLFEQHDSVGLPALPMILDFSESVGIEHAELIFSIREILNEISGF